MMNILASSIIDLGALWKILAVSILAGAGVVAAFGYVLIGVSRYQTAGNWNGRARYILLIATAGIFCAAAIVLGLIALAHK